MGLVVLLDTSSAYFVHVVSGMRLSTVLVAAILGRVFVWLLLLQWIMARLPLQTAYAMTFSVPRRAALSFTPQLVYVMRLTELPRPSGGTVDIEQV